MTSKQQKIIKTTIALLKQLLDGDIPPEKTEDTLLGARGLMGAALGED